MKIGIDINDIIRDNYEAYVKILESRIENKLKIEELGLTNDDLDEFNSDFSDIVDANVFDDFYKLGKKYKLSNSELFECLFEDNAFKASGSALLIDPNNAFPIINSVYSKIKQEFGNNVDITHFSFETDRINKSATTYFLGYNNILFDTFTFHTKYQDILSYDFVITSNPKLITLLQKKKRNFCGLQKPYLTKKINNLENMYSDLKELLNNL